MAIESWLPIGFALPGGIRAGRPRAEGLHWQIVEDADGDQALLVREELHKRWLTSALVSEGDFDSFFFGLNKMLCVTSPRGQLLAPVSDCRSPRSKVEALAFAIALEATRQIERRVPLQDSVYVQKLSRLLPTYSISSQVTDDHILGYWLTGGARISANATRRLGQMLSWLSVGNLDEVVTASGVKTLPRSQTNLDDADDYLVGTIEAADEGATGSGLDSSNPFQLPGRHDLEQFFNEHVVDIIRNKERYAALGVMFPSAIVLHGPPGCGKTFAVEQLVEFLGWPSYQIDATSVASPYIHETSKKVAAVFEKAMKNSPSVLVIDEMEAFLADRESGSGSSHHRVEEVAEFLRRIPEAAKNEVLIVGMTNRLEMIDAAIIRRGRFDHVIAVDPASEQEVKALLEKLLGKLPGHDALDSSPLSRKLAGRPLSDVAFVVREGARLSARSGLGHIEQSFLLEALQAAPSRSEQGTGRRIGFV